MNAARLIDAADEPTFGGKASQLARALRAGLPVPAGMALSATLVEQAAAGDPTGLALLAEAARQFAGPWAVRSSAIGEDSREASFAGQHVTMLNVNSATALEDAVRTILQSVRSEAALAYRRRLGLAGEPRSGVVLQELVLSDIAGVLFTRNPLDGADERVIEASWGLGESVVAGLVTPDRFRLSPTGEVLERATGAKDVATRSLPEGGTGVLPVEPARARGLCLDDGQLARLHALATRCEEVFGPSQDLEWAIAGEALYLLQSRPITGRSV